MARDRSEIEGRLCDLLLEKDLIEPAKLESARLLSRTQNLRLAEALEQQRAIPKGALVETLGELYDLPAVDLAETFGDPLVLDELPRDQALKLEAVPLYLVEGQLTVAVAEPENLESLDRLQFCSGHRVLPVVALPGQLRKRLQEAYGPAESGLVGELVFDEVPEQAAEALETDDSRPIVRLVNLILMRAIQERSTDVHLEPQEDRVAVRFRVDGQLQVLPYEIPPALRTAVTSRIKVLASLDIAEKRLPQDGKIQLAYSGRRIDVRVSTFPTIHGEKVVLRLLDKSRTDFTLERVGLSPSLLEQWKSFVAIHEGLVLVSGPTGSGKSSTLYATLRYLNEPEVNIVTLEDPVEYELEGISQAQVKPSAGFDFADGLRSILRQDPDVILLGEIRDGETARIAAQAATTGHLVLATVHTNDALSAVSRLVDLGVPPFMVAAALRGVLAQRLVRSVCPECVERAEVPTVAERLGSRASWLGEGFERGGCELCAGRGYAGRTGVFELLEVSSELRELIATAASPAEFGRCARENGYREMWWNGMEKVSEGVTTLDELMRHVAVAEDQRGGKSGPRPMISAVV